MRGSISTCVTLAPNRAKACASSQPIGPPPSTTRRGGSLRRSQSDSEVRYRILSRPGIGGTKGAAPAAMTIERVVRRRVVPSSRRISTSQGDTIFASPMMHSTPICVKRSTESCGSMVFTTRWTRSMTSAKSNSATALLSPYSFARRIWASTRAVLISALEGTQPVFRQSPPISCFSTSVTFAFTTAAIRAATSPPEPAPITTMLRSNFAGFVQRA